jgi:hypothetical protein
MMHILFEVIELLTKVFDQCFGLVRRLKIS